MGYANSMPYSQITLHSIASASASPVTITDSVWDYTFSQIHVPSFHRQPDYAYLDVIVPISRDSSGFDNYFLSSGSFGIISHSTLTYHASRNMPLRSVYTLSGTTIGSYLLLGGENNLAPYMESDTDNDIKFYQVKCLANNLILYGVWAELRLYWGDI